MKKSKGFLLTLLALVFIANSFVICNAKAQEKKTLFFSPKSDLKENNTIALLKEVSKNGKDTVALLTEIRDMLKKQIGNKAENQNENQTK